MVLLRFLNISIRVFCLNKFMQNGKQHKINKNFIRPYRMLLFKKKISCED